VAQSGILWETIPNSLPSTFKHLFEVVIGKPSLRHLRHRYYPSVTVQWPESSKIKIPESLRWRPLIMPRPVLIYKHPSCIWILCCDITGQLTVFTRFNKQQMIIKINKNFRHLKLKIMCWQYSILKHYDLWLGILNQIFLASVSSLHPLKAHS
jgi:hypothetical protein